MVSKSTVAQSGLREGRDGRVEIHGDLSFASVPGLWKQCAERLAAGDAPDIDLGHVQRSDSAGLALLLECLRATSQTGKSIRFYNIPAQMLAIARASSLDQVLPLHRD